MVPNRATHHIYFLDIAKWCETNLDPSDIRYTDLDLDSFNKKDPLPTNPTKRTMKVLVVSCKIFLKSSYEKELKIT